MTSEQKVSKLATVSANKTVVFYSPVEGQDVLVRTGVMGNDDSFLHALLHAHSKEYVQEEETEREKLVTKLKLNLMDKLDKKQWDRESTSLSVQLLFQNLIKDVLVDFYSSVKNEKAGKLSKSIYKSLSKYIETYQIIFELIPIGKMKNILIDVYALCGNDGMEKCKIEVVKRFKELGNDVFGSLGDDLDEKRKSHCIGKLTQLITEIVEGAEDKIRSEYKEKPKKFVLDDYAIELFSNKLNRDIYFINASTRVPYKFGVHTGRKTIILLWMGGSKYEVIGKLLPGNRIQREFYKDDPLVRRINVFLYKPELVAEQYPNLVPYLPKEHKDKMKLYTKSVSRSGSEEKETEEESKSSERSETSESSERSDTPKHKPSKRKSRK